MNLRINEKDESGFTIVEVIVVVIIMAVLALIAIPTFLHQRKAAWNSAVQSDVSNAAMRIVQTKDYSGTLPDTKRSADVVLRVVPGNSLAVAKGNNNACVEGYHAKSQSDTTWSFNIKERQIKNGGCQLG